MTNFVWYNGGSNGFLSSFFDMLSTELNALAAGAAVTSSVGGSSGVFTQTDYSSALLGYAQFLAGGAMTPTAGGLILVWMLQNLDGTNYESLVSTPSQTVPALPRPPNLVIPIYEGGAALSSTSRKMSIGPGLIFPGKQKIVAQNWGTVALPATGNKISFVAPAVAY